MNEYVQTAISVICILTYHCPQNFKDMVEFGYDVNLGAVPFRLTSEEDFIELDDNTTVDFTYIAKQYGYEAKDYTFYTSDDYMLVMHRITESPLCTEAAKKAVIYMQHGFLASSDSWIVLGPDRSLAFQLADACYDVWLGNVRGNSYSRYHKYYEIKSQEYWNFSLEEMAKYDIIASIDFALKESKQKKLTYIGHSMGSTLSYILLSLFPEYNEKINILISLSPVAFFTQENYPILNLFRLFADAMDSIIPLLSSIFSIKEILPLTTGTINIARHRCTNPRANICKSILEPMMNTTSLDSSSYAKIFSTFPAGSSARTLTHFKQLLGSKGKFQRYDYQCYENDCQNLVQYGQEEPPEFDLSKIAVRVALIFSENDGIVNVKDVEYLKNKMNNSKILKTIQVTDPLFNHMDFLWSSSSKYLVNDRVLSIVEMNTAVAILEDSDYF